MKNNFVKIKKSTDSSSSLNDEIKSPIMHTGYAVSVAENVTVFDFQPTEVKTPLQQEVEQLRKLLADKTYNVDKLEQELFEANAKIKELNDNIKVKDFMDAKKESLLVEKDETINLLRSTEKDFDQIKKLFNKKEEHATALEKQVVELTEKLKTTNILEKKVAELTEQLKDSSGLNQQPERTTELEKQVKKLIKKVEKTEEKVIEYKETINELKEDKITLKEDKAILLANLKELKSDKLELSKSLSLMNEDLKALKESHTSIEKVDMPINFADISITHSHLFQGDDTLQSHVLLSGNVEDALGNA